MKKLLVLLFLLLTFLFGAETSLGGISLGDTFDEVFAKYPEFGVWKDLEPVSPPYPLHVITKDPVYLAQSEKLDIICYFNEHKKVVAVAVYFYEKEDNSVYETTSGLRAGDGPIEIKLLYGNPVDISEFAYRDENKEEVVRRMYYYPNLCIHTSQQTVKKELLPEIVESIVLAKYDMKYVLRHKADLQKRPKKNKPNKKTKPKKKK